MKKKYSWHARRKMARIRVKDLDKHGDWILKQLGMDMVQLKDLFRGDGIESWDDFTENTMIKLCAVFGVERYYGEAKKREAKGLGGKVALKELYKNLR